jgi:hypothetical protein
MSPVLRIVLCRILIVLTAWSPLQIAQAGMIGTEQTLSPQGEMDRAHVMSILNRGDVSVQLQAFGLDPAKVRDRVQAMTDQEVAALAQKLDSLPAGGRSDGAVLLLIIIIAAIIWWVAGRPGMSGSR